jgi:integrase
MDRQCSLLDPESVKRLIASKGWNAGGKQRVTEAVDRFYKYSGIQWQRPKYERVEMLPFIPHTEEVDALINGLYNPLHAIFCHFIKDTGARSGEAWMTEWVNVDMVSRLVSIKPEKGSRPRALKISIGLWEKLNQLPKDRKYIFHEENIDPIKGLPRFNRAFLRGRRVVAKRLGNPRINLISWRTLRHYKATMEYHKTRDIIHVQQVLGHRSINNTLRYVQLVPNEEEDYIVKIVTTREDRVKLLEDGFDLIQKDGEEWYLRKRK